MRTALRHRSDDELDLQLRAFPLTGARSSVRWLVQATEPAAGASGDGDRGRGSAAMMKEWAWDQLAIPVAVCDRETRLVAVNQRMVALTGRSEAELLAGGLDDIIPPGAESLDGIGRVADEVLREGETLRHTARVAGGAGAEERIWSMALSPLAASDDRVRALSVAFVEVTQQAQARRRLAVVNDASIRLGRTLDVTETAQELASVGMEFADYVTVDLLDAVLDGGEVDPALPVGRPLVFRRVAQDSVQPGCPPFEAVRLQVPDGSLLVFYTNGVIGASDGDMDVGLGLLRDTLHRHTGSLEQTCDSVVAAILQERPSDDIALLLAQTRTLDASQVATWDLSSDPATVGEARSQVSRRLSDWGLEDLAFTSELIVSELVTNAIRYGSEPLQLRLIREESLTCEVADSSSAVPRVRRARMFDEGGRGLLVVGQLADRWGSRHTEDGKIIWAEQFLAER